MKIYVEAILIEKTMTYGFQYVQMRRVFDRPFDENGRREVSRAKLREKALLCCVCLTLITEKVCSVCQRMI